MLAKGPVCHLKLHSCLYPCAHHVDQEGFDGPLTCSKSRGAASSTQAMATESWVRKETKSLGPRRERLHALRKQDFIPLEDSTTVTDSQSSVSPAQAVPNWQLCTGAKTSVRPWALALTMPRKTTFTEKWLDPTLFSCALCLPTIVNPGWQ